VYLFFHGAHNDEGFWKDPKTFRPERFLDENNELQHTDRVIPFSLGTNSVSRWQCYWHLVYVVLSNVILGKRNCIGALLAQSSLFLGLTSLVQNFMIKHDPAYGIPTNEIQLGFTLSPTPFNIILERIAEE